MIEEAEGMKSLLGSHLIMDDKMAKNARPVKGRSDLGTMRIVSLFAETSNSAPTTRNSKHLSEE